MSTRENISPRRDALLGDEPGAFAIARYVRSTPMKTRRIADWARGSDVDDALTLLQSQPQSVARTLYRLVASSVANAEESEGLEQTELVTSRVTVDAGTTRKGWRRRA